MQINNKASKSIINTVLGCLFSVTCFAAITPEPRGNNPEMAVSGKTVSMAIKGLGHDARRYKDKEGNPHFVIADKIGSAESVAIFMDDCGKAGCEDVILYANFGKADKLSTEAMNEWNHISSMLRSRLARSSNGEIALSMPVSFFNDQDHEKMAMMIGMFFVEINMLSATIDNLK